MRDSRGRFASTPGGGKKAPSGLPKRSPRKAGTPPPKRRGLVTQRAAVRRASAKLKGLDTSGSYSGALRQRGQKAAVTRAGNQLKAAEATGRRRIAGGKVQGVVRPGSRTSASPKGQRSPLGPEQIAGARKRASETPEAFAKRKLDMVRFKLNQLQERKGLQESDLKRRRGRLEGEARKKAARALRKTQRSMSNLKEAEQRYSTAVTRIQDRRNWEILVRTRRKAPANERTARNRLETMQRRVRYYRRTEDRPRYAWGKEYAGPELARASTDRGVAIAGISGQRYMFRSRAKAITAQRERRERTIRAGKPVRRLGVTYGHSIHHFYRRGTSMQGDLFTGAFKKTRSGGLRGLVRYKPSPKPKPRRRKR